MGVSTLKKWGGGGPWPPAPPVPTPMHGDRFSHCLTSGWRIQKDVFEYGEVGG